MLVCVCVFVWSALTSTAAWPWTDAMRVECGLYVDTHQSERKYMFSCFSATGQWFIHRRRHLCCNSATIVADHIHRSVYLYIWHIGCAYDVCALLIRSARQPFDHNQYHSMPHTGHMIQRIRAFGHPHLTARLHIYINRWWSARTSW